MNKLQHTNLGMSAYIEWETLDVILSRWAYDTFVNPGRLIPIRIYAARDEMSFNIEINYLQPYDINVWKDIFAKYDKEQEWDADAEFKNINNTLVIPSTMSMRILFESVHKHTCIGFMPKALIANEYGIVFYEMAPKGFSHFFTAEEEA